MESQNRCLIFGNSGSGKSTLARKLSAIRFLPHLDLDTIAWKGDKPGVREDHEVSIQKFKEFSEANNSWVVEGCYTSLLGVAAEQATELIFLNPGIKQCQENCRNRPWEPHKYSSKAAQDKNLEMLLQWVAAYETREDEFSLSAHRKLFDEFTGMKREIKSQKTP